MPQDRRRSQSLKIGQHFSGQAFKNAFNSMEFGYDFADELWNHQKSGHIKKGDNTKKGKHSNGANPQDSPPQLPRPSPLKQRGVSSQSALSASSPRGHRQLHSLAIQHSHGNGVNPHSPHHGKHRSHSQDHVHRSHSQEHIKGHNKHTPRNSGRKSGNNKSPHSHHSGQHHKSNHNKHYFNLNNSLNNSLNNKSINLDNSQQKPESNISIDLLGGDSTHKSRRYNGNNTVWDTEMGTSHPALARSRSLDYGDADDDDVSYSDASDVGDHHNNGNHHGGDEHNCDSSTFCGDPSQAHDRIQQSKRHLGIARREECNVRYIRCVTLSFILLSAFAVCFLIYGFAREVDHHEFLSKYESYAKQIQKDVIWDVKYNIALMKQLGVTITSEILATQQTPPFATLPRFEVMGGFTEGLGDIMMTSYIPIVHNTELEKWQNYSVAHQDWLDESERLRVSFSDVYLETEVDHQKHHKENHLHHLHDGNFHTHTGHMHNDKFHSHGKPSHSFEASTTQGHADNSHTWDTYEEPKTRPSNTSRIPEMVWYWRDGQRTPLVRSKRNDGLIAPLWHITPARADTVNVDLLSDPTIARLFESMFEMNYQTVRSKGEPIGDLFDFMYDETRRRRRLHLSKAQKDEPHSFMLEPLFANLTSKEDAVASNMMPIGMVLGMTSYRQLFQNILDDDDAKHPMYAVLEGTGDCGEPMTYLIKGPEAEFVGRGNNFHEEEMARYLWGFEVDDYENVIPDICSRRITLYPSITFQEEYSSPTAWVYTGIVALAFMVTCFCFLIYERLVTKREKTKNAALEVVASLFPSGVQDRVLEGVQDGHHGTPERGEVIASFFPATTVMFADIAGFTAWSSTRDPEQVFRLLETVYGAIDEIAVRRGVFKVETVGDCYVAVCGLPEPMDDHAVAMTRFAKDCQLRMASLSRQLEVALGPDTADLSFRIGLHSGPVTGGVLRGQNARFQLFGDTMNQASRMESTGIKDRIQMSEQTARLLQQAGKGKWIEKRTEKVDVKGKGLQQTYFVRETNSVGALTRSTASASSGDPGPSNIVASPGGNNGTGELEIAGQGGTGHPRRAKRPSMESIVSNAAEQEALERCLPNKTQRLVTWNTEVLLRRIRSIVHHREHSSSLDHGGSLHTELSPKVIEQLKRHVQHISSMYRDNAFHSYEHASHVTMSMEKMLSNVKGPESSFSAGDSSTEFNYSRYTSDLANDPLAQFAVVYSALIHDVDHTGASNAQLMKEKNWLAIQYNGKSPAENHSIDLAWSTLMLPDYRDLLDCLCPSTRELERLKQLITDAVLATDIFDEDLIKNRNERWQQVFGEGPVTDPENVDKLRVMIVLDHLIQASDVAHTMQHWHVYIKWNERLFWEMSDAFRAGRLAKDPAEFWFDGELGFFDKYVIPLAKKIRECGVFGVTCYEFLNYAETNRNEWETKGKALVKDYVRRYREAHPKSEDVSPGGYNRKPYPRSRTMSHCATTFTRQPPVRTKSLPEVEPNKKPQGNPAA